MLGKGLESLIPKNGSQGQNNQPGNEPARPAQQPALPAEPVREELPAPVTEPQLPAPQSHPSFVPPANPSPRVAQPVQPVQPMTQQPAAKKIEWPSPQPKPAEPPSGSIYQIELDKIVANPDQPRRHFDQEALHELANSIREFGLLQPIVVSKIDRETHSGIEVEYQIIAGERRFMAAKLLGLPRVPAIIRNVSLEREKLELGVIENIQRENLNPIEMARAFQRLQEEFRMTQREIAAKLGKSREVVANMVRLLDLPEYIQIAVEKGEVSESNARLLISIEDPGMQKRLLEEIIQNKLTTRDVRMRVDAAMSATAASNAVAGIPAIRRRGRPPKEETHLPPEVKMLQDELRIALGAPVDIVKNANNGKITITFFSEEELEEILKKLGKERE